MNFVAVHAHFYQPPRENPWTELIEPQSGAWPHRDWNERISHECYERYGMVAERSGSAVARYLDLFSKTSWNLGPTLAAWLDRERPGVLADARRGNDACIAAHGTSAALMQAYGHAILPLCNERERSLQLAWGHADFVGRFGHPPMGVWLPECAVDVATLEACADRGLRYTIVAPEQIAAVRPLDGEDWTEIPHDREPPTHRPFEVRLPSGRTFLIFAFHGPLSREAVFGETLADGERLAQAIRDVASGEGDEDRLTLLAADGETYGHHKRHGHESLAKGLSILQRDDSLRVVPLGALVDRLPPTHEARLVEPSSWSCAHGVERWRSGCGCGLAAERGEDSLAWRGPLREAAGSLRDSVFEAFERRGGELLADPWGAAERLGAVLASPPDPDRLRAFLAGEARAGTDSDLRDAADALEAIRQTLFAATSCGWFFDDVGRIETIQVMRHAARASELAHRALGIDPEPDYESTLDACHSVLEGGRSGSALYRSARDTARRRPEELPRTWRARHAAAPASVAERLGIWAVEPEADRLRLVQLRTLEERSAPLGAEPHSAVPLLDEESHIAASDLIADWWNGARADTAIRLLEPYLDLAEKEASTMPPELRAVAAVTGRAAWRASSRSSCRPVGVRLRELDVAVSALGLVGEEAWLDLAAPIALALERVSEEAIGRGNADELERLATVCARARHLLGEVAVDRARRALLASRTAGGPALPRSLVTALDLVPDEGT